ncbi:MAG TPA: hypothetical protein VNU70_01075, partial [Puia sp.]|nr:hypothetical protein [Puia sp.]
LYTQAQRIGTDRLNDVLRDFFRRWALRKEGPYAGSPDLYQSLRQNTPDSLQNWLRDNWEKPGPPPNSP